ncbi:major facilitator superfamily domain-containing protein [Mycena floridula]|nr:major facilitator superfamily domain-containing protein [Mycena floridula]
MSSTTSTTASISDAEKQVSDIEKQIVLSPTATLCNEEGVCDLKKAPTELSSLRKSLILLVLSGALFFDIYNACAVITALPTLGKDLGFSSSSLQWVVSGYTLTFAAFMLVSGRLSDIFHPKPVFVAGFLVVGVLAIPIGASVNPIMMIVLRAIQGIGAAMNTPTAVAMVSTTFPNPKEQSRAYAVYGAVGAVGNVAGFVIGGVLTDRLSWRWVFYLLAIIVIPFAAASWFILPTHENHQHEEKPTIDWPGVFSLTVGLILFVFGISEGSGSQWATPRVIVPLVLSIVMFAAFFFIERIVKSPALPPATWSNKNFLPLFFYAWSVYWWVFGVQVQFVEVFMDMWGMTALSAAIHCLPMGISGGISSFLTGRFGQMVPKKILLVTGQALMAVGAILFALADSKDKYWSHIVPGMIIGMFGLAMSYVGCTITMMEGARSGEEGVVGAMMYTSYQIGATLGLAVISSITIGVNAHVVSQDPSVLFKGYQASFWSLLGLNGIMALVALIFVRN